MNEPVWAAQVLLPRFRLQFGLIYPVLSEPAQDVETGLKRLSFVFVLKQKNPKMTPRRAHELALLKAEEKKGFNEQR